MITDPNHPDYFEHVPKNIMALTQHLHNLIYIRYFYESLGTPTPDWIKKEQLRADRVLQAEIDREHQQGGAFHKGAEQCDKEERAPVVLGNRSGNQSLRRRM